MTLDEMVDALAVETDAEEQDVSKNRMPFPDEIAGYASTLVSFVVRETTAGTVKELQLAHLSVKEYLTSGRAREKRFEEADAKADMTNVCLGYLLHLKKPMPVKDLRATFPFAQFCARYWLGYAAVAETKDETAKKIQKFASRFLTSKEGSYANCYRLYRPDYPGLTEPNDDKMEPAHALYYTSFGGLPISTKALLERKADVNEQGRNPNNALYGNALQAASYSGHCEIVQQLLDAGADVNAKWGYRTALYAASEEGHEKVVRLLLDHGADVNARDRYGGALHIASGKGHEEVVRLLLDHGADVNAPGGYGSALYAASASGRKEVVRLLLDYGADVNSRGRYGNAISIASAKGDKEIVRLLQDRGADVNTN